MYLSRAYYVSMLLALGMKKSLIQTNKSLVRNVPSSVGHSRKWACETYLWGHERVWTAQERRPRDAVKRQGQGRAVLWGDMRAERESEGSHLDILRGDWRGGGPGARPPAWP